MPTLSILVPAYNEERTIREILERIRKIDLGSVKKEIVVVDDGSLDRTPEILSNLDWPELVRIRHERNAGKGRAIRTGLAKATGDVVLVQDADLEYDPADYPRLLAPILEGRAKVVYGSRFAPKEGSGPDLSAYPLTHRLGVGLLNQLCRLLYGVETTDEATCYKAFAREVIDRMPLDCERFEFCPEVTAKAARLGYAILEVPISFRPRTVAEGKKIRWRDGWTAARTLWRYRKWGPPSTAAPGAQLPTSSSR